MRHSQSSRFVSLPALLVAFACLSVVALGASPLEAQWASNTSQPSGDRWFGWTALDSAGSVYVPVCIRGPDVVNFGNGVTARDAKPDSWNGVLLKYDAKGVAQWARSITGTPTDSEYRKAVVDGSGNIYVIGYIGKGTFDFGNGVTAVGIYPYVAFAEGYYGMRRGNALLVKFDPAGNALWARTLVAASDPSAYRGIAVDSAGNVFCVGIIDKGTFDFGDGAVVSAGKDTDGSSVVVKYDPSGKVLWARTVPTRPTWKWHVWYLSAAVDSGGNLYVGGSVGNQAFDFGNGVTLKPAIGEAHACLVKYDTNGNALWVRTASFGCDIYQTVAVDASGSVYAAGTMNTNFTVQFGNSVTLRVNGGADQVFNMVVAKFDGEGNTRWARSVAAASCDSLPSELTTDASGNAYVTGTIFRDGVFDFGNGVTVKGPYFGFSGSSKGENAVIVKLDPGGAPQWAQTVAQSTANTYFQSVVIDPSGGVLITANVQGGLVEFGPGVAATVEGRWYNGVLVKYGFPPE